MFTGWVKGLGSCLSCTLEIFKYFLLNLAQLDLSCSNRQWTYALLDQVASRHDLPCNIRISCSSRSIGTILQGLFLRSACFQGRCGGGDALRGSRGCRVPNRREEIGGCGVAAGRPWLSADFAFNTRLSWPSLWELADWMNGLRRNASLGWGFGNYSGMDVL